MTIMREHAVEEKAGSPLSMLWAEITGKCPLTCTHCYAGSGPDGTHGTMTPGDWERVLAEAAELGTRMVCFIGGEPVMHPDLPRLVRHAVDLGMEVEVFSNLVSVTPALWDLFETPGVRLATSWYTSNRLEHRQITGRDTFRQTLGNIDEALQRKIPLRVGLITGILPGQHAQEGEELLRARGVGNIGTDHLREFGRGANPDLSQACGNCGNGRAAVLPDGSVTPCPLTRWMTAGSMHRQPLAEIVYGDRMAGIMAVIPRPTAQCNPHDSDCKPNAEVCYPAYCNPDKGEPDEGEDEDGQ